jgi:hypothetical protein
VSPCRKFDYHIHKKHVVQRALVGHLYGSQQLGQDRSFNVVTNVDHHQEAAQ